MNTIWFRQNPKKTLLFFTAFLCLVLLLLLEIALRISGAEPGKLSDNMHLYVRDTLIFRDDYKVDEAGIMKISPAKRYYTNNNHEFIQEGVWDDVYLFDCEFEFSLRKVVYDMRLQQSTFHDYVALLKKKSQPTEIEQAYIDFTQSPINAEGFRSIPFKNYTTDKTKLLLLGDSFTWGLNVNPITNCFADLMATKDYAVFNSGIVGADPAQYLAVAEKYIPVIKPDVVVVNYFLGNDHMHYYRTPKEGEFIYYQTNEGWIRAAPQGYYLSLEDAYDFTIEQMRIRVEKGNWWDNLCAKTVLTTRLWRFAYQLQTPLRNKFKNWKGEPTNPHQKHPVSYTYLKKIEQLCTANQAIMLLAIIPSYHDLDRPDHLFLKKVFQDLPYSFPENLILSDYNPDPDGHFNAQGSVRYADFLDEEIQKIMPYK